MPFETGAKSHLDRMNLTKRLSEQLEPLFMEHGVSAVEYGQNVLLQGNPGLTSRLRKLDVKKSDVICMKKFSPDFVLWKEPIAFLMLDAKVSITPMFFDAAITRLRVEAGDLSLDRHRIGEVEREAWDNYTKRYPVKKVAICMATPYNPNLVLAEWASELVALHRYEGDINEEAEGSGTPHVNIDLGKMRTLQDFLTEELGVNVDVRMYNDLLDEVKEWPLSKPGRVNWRQFNNVVYRLHHKCPWLKGRMPRVHPFARAVVREFADAGIDLELF